MNEVEYSTNLMGPISKQWYKDNGFLSVVGQAFYSPRISGWVFSYPIEKHWAGGRIDVYGTESQYREEIGVPIMTTKSWNKLSDWCNTYTTEEIDWDILNTFQQSTGHNIEFFNYE